MAQIEEEEVAAVAEPVVVVMLGQDGVAADKSAHSQLPEPRLHTVAHTASSDYLQQCCVCDWDHTGIVVLLFAAAARAAAVVDRVGIAVDSFGKAYRRVTVVAALILMYHVMLSDSD